MIDLIVPPIWCAIADRVRGGFPDERMWKEKPKPRWVDYVRDAIKFTYGAALVLPFTHTWWHLVVAGITWKFGEQIASDFGGTFRLIAGKDKWLSPLIRVGLTWPIAMVVTLGYFCPPMLMLLAVSGIASVFSACIAFLCFKSQRLATWNQKLPTTILQLNTGSPAWQEALRGFINGGLAAIIGANL